MTTPANQLERNSDSRQGRRGGWWVVLALAGCAALAFGVGGLIWYHTRTPETPGPDAVREPPGLELDGVDAAVVKAISTARTAVGQSPRSAAAWGHLGQTLLAHDFFVPGRTCLAEAEQLDSREPRWSYLQGLSLATNDPTDPEAAVPKLRQAARLCGDKPDAPRLRLGEVLFTLDRLDEAEQEFMDVLRRNPANARAQLGLGRLTFRRGDLERSMAYLALAMDDRHTRKASRTLLAEIHQRLGQPKARDELRQASELPPDPPWPDPFREELARLRTGKKAFLSRASLLLGRGQGVEALALLRQTVHDYPDADAAWLMLGRGLIQQRDLPAAEQALRTTVRLAPHSVEGQFRLGVALSLQGNHRDALACFRKAIELKPDFSRAYHNLGVSLNQLGDRAEAIKALRAAVGCDPEMANAHVLLGELLAKNGQPGEAMRHLRTALELKPGDPQAKRLFAQILQQIWLPVFP